MTDTFHERSTRLLIVAQDQTIKLLQDCLSQAGPDLFAAQFTACLDEALLLLRDDQWDALLFDLSLPELPALDILPQIMAQSPDVALIGLYPHPDEGLGMRAVREGAQDFLIVQPDLDCAQFQRSISFAVERQRKRAVLQHLSFYDDLTGILNRRGFLSLAVQHLKIARRVDWDLTLLFLDLDGLKQINDQFGHTEGDRALRAVASMLRETFRSSDLIARLGGDEFVVLAINASGHGLETITSRLQENLAACNQRRDHYQLSVSWGVARFPATTDLSMEEMIALADESQYAHKRQKRRPAGG